MLFVDKYKPYFSPDMEVGAEQDVGLPEGAIAENIQEQGIPEPADGPGSGRSKLRKQLETSVAEVNKRTQEKPAKYVSRARQEGTAAPEAEEEPEAEQEGQEQEAKPATNPPEAWAKEAKAEWAKVPTNAQAAILKREEDVAKGVHALQSYYRDLEEVLSPRYELFKQYNKTPAQAVNQLFGWFDALGGNPDQAFPALMRTFNYDPRRLIPFINQLGGQQQQQQPEGEQEVPPAYLQYINQLEQRVAGLTDAVSKKIGGLENMFAQQNQARVQETLDVWSANKPHFEKVRVMMGHLLESGQVPPLPNGAADLDKAYDMALWALPEVRQQVMADIEAKRAAELKAKQDAERKAQKEAADKARRASGGLGPSAPGSPVNPNQSRRPQRKSVRESLADAIAEVRGE